MPNQTLQLPTCYPQNDTVFLIKWRVGIITVAILTTVISCDRKSTTILIQI